MLKPETLLYRKTKAILYFSIFATVFGCISGPNANDGPGYIQNYFLTSDESQS